MEQLKFNFADTTETPTQPTVSSPNPTKSVTISLHPKGFAVKMDGTNEILVFPHLGTALSEAKRFFVG